MNRLPLKENLKKYTCISECPVRNILARFSGKWSILVLCVLAENEATRFNAVAKAIPDISLAQTVCGNTSEGGVFPYSAWL